jgi:hypothetical protein
MKIGRAKKKYKEKTRLSISLSANNIWPDLETGPPQWEVGGKGMAFEVYGDDKCRSRFLLPILLI